MKLFHSAIPWPLQPVPGGRGVPARLPPGQRVELGHQLLDRLAGRLQQPVRGGLLGVVAAGVDQPVPVHLPVGVVGQQQRDLPRVGLGDRGRAAPLHRRPGRRARVHADLHRQAAQPGAAGEGLHPQRVHPVPGGLQLERGPGRVLPRDHAHHLPLRAAQGEPGTVHQQQHDIEPGLGHRQRRQPRLQPRTGLQPQPHQQRHLLTQPHPLGEPALQQPLLRNRRGGLHWRRRRRARAHHRGPAGRRFGPRRSRSGPARRPPRRCR